MKKLLVLALGLAISTMGFAQAYTKTHTKTYTPTPTVTETPTGSFTVTKTHTPTVTQMPVGVSNLETDNEILNNVYDDTLEALKVDASSASGIGIDSMNVQGATPDGQPNTANAVVIGGKNGDDTVKTMRVDHDGAVAITEHTHLLDDCEATTGWTAVNDAASIATSTTHIEGQFGLFFNKAGGSNVEGGLQRTLGTAIEMEEPENLQLHGLMYLPDAASVTNTVYVWFRLGEDASNYLEYRKLQADLAAGWNTLLGPVTAPTTQVGDGTSAGDIQYIAWGVVTDDSTDTITGIGADMLKTQYILKNTIVQAPAAVSLGTVDVDDPVAGTQTNDMKIADGGNDISVDWGGTVPPIGGGTEAAALRVSMASDSTGLLSVDDNAGALTTDWAGVAPPIGAGTEATALKVTVANDSTGLLSVDDNGSSLTVDGSVALTAGVTVADPLGGGVEASAVRVTMASDSTGLLSVDDNAGALTTDWAGVAPPIGAGTEATALKVTVANDSTGLLSVDDNGSSLTVDGSVALTAGVTVADPLGGGVEAGAVLMTVASDSTGLLSVDDNAGALTTDWAGVAPPIGGGAEATALKVTVANNSTGLLSVDDNGSTLSVDDAAGALTTDWAGVAPPIGGGTEATALKVTMANDSTGLLSVDDNGGSLTVDVGSELPAGTQNIGKIKVTDGTHDAEISSDGALMVGGSDAPGADGLSNNSMIKAYGADGAEGAWVVAPMYFNGSNHDRARGTAAGGAWVQGPAAEGAAFAGNPLGFGVRYDSTLPTAVDDGDVIPALSDAYGRVRTGVEANNFTTTVNSADASGAGIVVKAGVAATKIYILSIIISTDTELSALLQDETGPTILIEKIYLASNGGFTMTFPAEAPLVVNTDEDLEVVASIAGNITVMITGYTGP